VSYRNHTSSGYVKRFKVMKGSQGEVSKGFKKACKKRDNVVRCKQKNPPALGRVFVLWASLASVAFAVVFGILVSGLLVF